MVGYSSALYQRSPIWFQETLINGKGLVRKTLREGSRFQAALQELRQTQWYSVEQLRDYQLRRMSALVRHAATNVPFYKAAFAREDLSVSDLRELEDFKKLPLLDKRQVVESRDRLIATDARRFKFKGATSGTSGLSFIGFRDLDAINREHAFIARQLSWAGVPEGARRAWIRGDLVVPSAQTSPPFWRHNRAENMLMLSSVHISEQSSRGYLKALETFNPAVIQAYPSSVAVLARFLLDRKKTYSGSALKAVVTSSETLLDEQRSAIERAFGCRVFDWYGNFERVAAIGTCEQGNYHIMSDYGLVELMPQEDGSAELAATGFDNYLMPLLRYQTGDSVVPAAADYRCPCGRFFPVVDKIMGRLDDYIKTPDGRVTGMMAAMFDGLDNLWEGQIVQDEPDEIRVRVVPMRPLSDADKADLETRARDIVGFDMQVTIEEVTEIVRTRAGKLRVVVCNL